jgi:MYXO-CTERM domain-containing protein
MRIAMRGTAAAIVLAPLTLGIPAAPCAAGFVTYNFIESVGGVVGGTITINSPPADTPGNWTAQAPGDITDFSILDPSIAPTGSYDTALTGLISGSGPDFRSGSLAGNQGAFFASTFISTANGSTLSGSLGSTQGTWTLSPPHGGAPAVPEPSAMTQAGLAGLLVATAAWARRRRAAALPR